jgi:hypothetical protein
VVDVVVVCDNICGDDVCEVVCDGVCDAVAVLLSAIVEFVGDNRSCPGGTACEGPFPLSALVATITDPTAASTTSVSTDSTDSF